MSSNSNCKSFFHDNSDGRWGPMFKAHKGCVCETYQLKLKNKNPILQILAYIIPRIFYILRFYFYFYFYSSIF